MLPYSSNFSWHIIFVIFVINPSFTIFCSRTLSYIVISKLMGVAFSRAVCHRLAEFSPLFLKKILHIELIFLGKCPTILSSSPCSCETLTTNGSWPLVSYMIASYTRLCFEAEHWHFFAMNVTQCQSDKNSRLVRHVDTGNVNN